MLQTALGGKAIAVDLLNCGVEGIMATHNRCCCSNDTHTRTGRRRWLPFKPQRVMPCYFVNAIFPQFATTLPVHGAATV